MYTALLILFAGIGVGRCLAAFVNPAMLRFPILCAVFLLLFLLGVAIGADNELLAQLPRIGWQAALLTMFCLAGSIFCAFLITPLLKKSVGIVADRTGHSRED